MSEELPSQPLTPEQQLCKHIATCVVDYYSLRRVLEFELEQPEEEQDTERIKQLEQQIKQTDNLTRMWMKRNLQGNDTLLDALRASISGFGEMYDDLMLPTNPQ